MKRFGQPLAQLAFIAFLCISPWFVSEATAQSVDELRRQAEQALGRPITNEEALQLLQRSGLTSAQVRERLAARGHDPSAADGFLAVFEGSADAVPGTATPLPLIEALTGSDFAASLAGDSLPAGFVEALRQLEGADEFTDFGPRVFGRDVFRDATTQFRPRVAGPVPAGYRIAPDDELIIVLTGDAELAYRLVVSREGWVAVPDVGRVDVAGLTIDQLRRRLIDRLSTVYSGLRPDGSGTMFLDLTLGSLHTNLVFVIGEVERPGAYEVGSFATALEALYPAGGPRRDGSFRTVRINRGERTQAIVDLYDYLLEGRTGSAPTLQDGDIVFVPPAGRRVEIDGAVRRPGIYELAEGDELSDVIRFAGGLSADAAAGRVQIERTLPPTEQQAGFNRVLLDVPLSQPGAETGTPLVDGDGLTVFTVLEDIRNTVQVTGGVWRPGSYGAEPGLRLWDVVERAGGLLPDAFEGRAQIQRLQTDYTRRMIQVTLERDASGRPVDNPVIEPLDEIYVFARRDLREDRAVSIGGWVRQPGVYPFVEGMSVRDLVLRAGGLRMGAFLGQVEISRVTISQTRSDTITETFAIALDSALVFDGSGRTGAVSRGQDFDLQNLDAVYVRRSPGFEPHRRVVVAGEVMFPGPYSAATRDERITDLIARAGGLTEEAYAEGLQLWRETDEDPTAQVGGAAAIVGQAIGDTALAEVPLGEDSTAVVVRVSEPRSEAEDEGIPRTRVGVDFVRALEDSSGPENILVAPNDSIFVPRFIPTIDVRGAVQAPTKVLYDEGRGGDYYIQRAGGYLRTADGGRARVQLANGEVRTRGGKFLFFGGGLPEPDPGSVITVPFKQQTESGTGSMELLTVLSGLLAATATVILAATR